MTLRIKTTDISDFSGYAYGFDNNERLDKYIEIFKNNDDFISFHIESTYNDLTIHQIAYIQDKLPDCKMFTKVDIDITSEGFKDATYILCFVKKEKKL